MQRRWVIRLQRGTQPGLGGLLHHNDAVAIAGDRPQLSQDRTRLREWTPMAMLMSESVGKDERVECV